jgi:hypothetical protein
MANNLLRILLIAVISPSARAESVDTAGKQLVAGIVIVGAGVAVGITLLILHEKHKTSSITGCVDSTTGGLSLTDDKDKRTYALWGDPVGIKPGDRMTLDGRRRLRDKMPVFEAHGVTKDLGACPPRTTI